MEQDTLHENLADYKIDNKKLLEDEYEKWVNKIKKSKNLFTSEYRDNFRNIITDKKNRPVCMGI